MYNIVDVNPQNVIREKFFCVKDVKNPGFESKQRWFPKTHKQGLRIF